MATDPKMNRINIQGHCFRCGEKIPEDRLTINIIGWLFSKAPGETNWSAGYPCCITFCGFCEDEMVRMTREKDLARTRGEIEAIQQAEATVQEKQNALLTGSGDYHLWPPAS